MGAFAELPGGSPVRVGVADDTYLVGSVGGLIEVWPALEETLAAHGHRFAAHKSHVLIPAWDAAELRGEARVDPTLAEFCARVPRSTGGLPMLGSAAQGKYETVLGPYAAVAAPARKRVEIASSHLASLRAMVRARVHEQADQVAWAIM